MTNPTKSPKFKARALNFFLYIATVLPQADELVGANLGSAPSKRWMRAHPHHMISTIDLDSPTIKNILDLGKIFNEAIDKASEEKIAFMVFQKPPPGVSPIVIISALSQSNNECSSFTADIMNAADFL